MEYIVKKEWYTLVFDYEEGSPSSKFSICEVSNNCNDDKQTQIYQTIDNKDLESIENVEPFCTGFIKWDGCLDINLNKHYCGYNTELQEILKDIYLSASDIIEGFNSECANLDKIK